MAWRRSPAGAVVTTIVRRRPKAPRPGSAGKTAAQAVLKAVHRIAPIWLVLAVSVAVVVWRDPPFAEPLSLMAFLKRGAPLIILALGQLFVIIAGDVDLSVGALITACVVIAARLGAGDPARTWWVVLLLIAFGLLVGVVNGLVTAVLRVPSFITTLGIMMVLNGAVFLWTGGSPTGSLAANLRQFGRGSIPDVPVTGQLPYAVIAVAMAVTTGYLLLRRTRFGHRVFATGGGLRTAWLSGVDTTRVRVGAFVVSALSGVCAAILLAGFAGLSANAGEGYEFQAIAAVVFGGAVLGGGRGRISAAVGGALTLLVLFTLLNLLGFAKPLRDTMQGITIIGAAVFTAYRLRRRR
jgi:ribose transport system permease protein